MMLLLLLLVLVPVLLVLVLVLVLVLPLLLLTEATTMMIMKTIGVLFTMARNEALLSFLTMYHSLPLY
jgi:hypothetical protein